MVGGYTGRAMTSDPVARDIYAGRIVTLRLTQFPQPDGSMILREIVEHAPGAAVVAVDANQHVLLVRQPRQAVGARLLELPAGLVDPGEEPLASARRELEEETGYTADHLRPLLRFYTSPGFCTELLHLFVGTGLRKVDVQPHADEQIELVRLPLLAAIDQVLKGEISDAKTVAGLLAYWRSTQP